MLVTQRVRTRRRCLPIGFSCLALLLVGPFDAAGQRTRDHRTGERESSSTGCSKPTLYEHSRLRGGSLELTESVADLHARGFGDAASSLCVPPGWRVTLYEDRDFRGASYSVSRPGSRANLHRAPGDREHWGDRASSVRVVRRDEARRARPPGDSKVHREPTVHDHRQSPEPGGAAKGGEEGGQAGESAVIADVDQKPASQQATDEREIDVQVTSRPRSVTLYWPDSETRPHEFVVDRRSGDEFWVRVCSMTLGVPGDREDEASDAPSQGSGVPDFATRRGARRLGEREATTGTEAAKYSRRCTDDGRTSGRRYVYRLRKWLLRPGSDGMERAGGPVSSVRVAARTELAAEAQCVHDVEAVFESLPRKLAGGHGSRKKEKFLAANSGIDRPYYSPPASHETNPKQLIASGDEHFQGIQRLGQYLIVSGGRKRSPRASQLVVIRMGSQSSEGPWALPEYHSEYDSKNPHPRDRVVDVVDIDRGHWHAGGIQIAGRVLAVPIYGAGDGSEVRYYDVSNVARPRPLEDLTLRRQGKTYAVALTRLPDGHYVTMAWDDRYLDFYYSNSKVLADGFDPDRRRFDKRDIDGGFRTGGCGADSSTLGKVTDPLGTAGDWLCKGMAKLKGTDKGCGTHQNLNFVNDCSGRVYLVGFRATHPVMVCPREDWATLYEVRWPRGYAGTPSLRKVAGKHMHCHGGRCNFGAGAGVYAADAGRFFIYATDPWLREGNQRYRFIEYSIEDPPSRP